MSHPPRIRLLRKPKVEEEIHVITNPATEDEPSARTPLMRQSSKLVRLPSSNQRQSAVPSDYEAPLTSHTLRPNSRWLLVRRNIHRIRFMGYSEQNKNGNVHTSIYYGIQMKRELKRAQEEIQNIDKDEHFQAVRRFILATDSTHRKTYKTSHVKPNDALVYDRLGDEPLALQNLLYYFSRQDVAHGTVFWDFLNEVNQVLHLRRKRTVLVQRLRRLALSLAIIFYTLIIVMFLLLLISVFFTITKMNDPEVRWTDSTQLKKDPTILLKP